jgi:hypothetical protein
MVASGTPTTISTGGYIADEMDILVVPEPGQGLMWASGLALLHWLRGRRERRQDPA